MAIAATLLVAPPGRAQELTQVPSEAEMQQRGCQYLREVSTGQTHIRKTIRISLGVFVRRGNADADFAVPAGINFTNYIAVMVPEHEAAYKTAVHLKYPEGRSDTVYQRDVPLERGRTYALPFRSPTQAQPYQVNLNISGENGNAYTIAAIACQR